VIPPAGVVEALLLCIPQRVFPFPPPFPPRALEGAARLQYWEQLRKFQPPSKEGGKEVRQEEGGEGRQGVWERMIRGRDMKGRAGTDGPPLTSELTFSCSKRMRFHVLYMQFILMMFCISPTDCHSPLQGGEEEEEEATKEIEKEEK